MALEDLFAGIHHAIGVTISSSEKVADIEDPVAIAIFGAVSQLADVWDAIAIAIDNEGGDVADIENPIVVTVGSTIGQLATVWDAIAIAVGCTRSNIADIENAIAIAIFSTFGQLAGIELAIPVAIVAFELEAIVDAIVVAIAAAGDIDILLIENTVTVTILHHLDHDGSTHVIELGPDADGFVIGSTGQVRAVGTPAHRSDRTSMALEGLLALSGGGIPDTNGIVVGATGETAAVGTPAH